ncbi:MAG: adenine phosphoribosyltransferase [Patescibacteria group bacterium]
MAKECVCGRPVTLIGHIENFPDFPKPGVTFRDISPLLACHLAFDTAINELSKIITSHRDCRDVTRAKSVKIAAVESRGFIFGAALAQKLNIGMVLLRKKGKLPGEIRSRDYGLEYGKDILEIRRGILKPGEWVVLVDDVLATGGTALAASQLLKSEDAEVIGQAFLINLPALNGADRLMREDTKSPIGWVLEF